MLRGYELSSRTQIRLLGELYRHGHHHVFTMLFCDVPQAMSIFSSKNLDIF